MVEKTPDTKLKFDSEQNVVLPRISVESILTLGD